MILSGGLRRKEKLGQKMGFGVAYGKSQARGIVGFRVRGT